VSGLFSVVFAYKSSSKMAALLLNCTAVEQRAVIRFLWSEGIKTSEIYRRMLAQYGEHCMAQKNVLLLHDNTCPHSAAVTVHAIRQLKFELLTPLT
jgi:hypothetical protein